MQEDHLYAECHIYADSQTAIKAIDNPRQRSGQAVIKDFLDCIDDNVEQYPGLQFTIIWISGHAEIDGNERMDTEVKNAAPNSALSRPFKYKSLKSARIMTLKDEAKKLWQKIWNENIKTAIALRRITKRKDIKPGPSLYNGLYRRHRWQNSCS